MKSLTSKVTTSALYSAAAVAILLGSAAFQPATAQQVSSTANLPSTEDAPFPNGKFQTRIGEFEISNGYPSTASVQKLFDAMDFQRATQGYIWALPLVSFADWKNEWRKQGAGNFDILRMVSFDQKHGLITPNMVTPYYIAFTDLNETGPLVVEAPAGAIAGGILDFWQRPVTDVGQTGPDKGKGGKYLIMPPGAKPIKADGYFVAESSTMNVFPAFRMLDPDVEAGRRLAGQIRIYPYDKRDNPPKTTVGETTEKFWSQMPPRGLEYWKRLSDTINAEPVHERDRVMMGMLKSIGIEKGKPFNPTDNQKNILLEAAFVGEAMAKANSYRKRIEKPYFDGRKWVNAIAMDASQESEHYTQIDERAAWFYEATTSTNGMKTPTPGFGQSYLASYEDSSGNWLDGGKSYRLRIPANPPAAQFWSVTLYSADTRLPLANSMKKADLSSRQNPVMNADETVDLYFGPKAPAGKEKNWVQTNAGEGWFVYFRIYGVKQEFLDRKWVMNDFERVE